MTQHDHDMTPPLRVTVEDAAKLLGLSVDAVRKRIERGTLRSEKVNKVRYVLLEGDMTDHDDDMTSPDIGMTSLVSSLQDQIRYLREVVETRDRELAEMRRLLAGALERIPELEAPREPAPEPPESPISPSETEEKGMSTTGHEEVDKEPRSWWRRVFGT